MVDSKLIFQRLTHTEGLFPWPKKEVPPDEVHIWGFLLDADAEAIHWARHCLSSEETERADRLVSERQRHEFVLAHAAVRMILGGYCERKPHELLFQRTQSGKPVLQSRDACLDTIRFNLTHSYGRALVAVGLRESRNRSSERNILVTRRGGRVGGARRSMPVVPGFAAARRENGRSRERKGERHVLAYSYPLGGPFLTMSYFLSAYWAVSAVGHGSAATKNKRRR